MTYAQILRRCRRVYRAKQVRFGWLLIGFGLRDWGLGIDVHFWEFFRLDVRFLFLKFVVGWQYKNTFKSVMRTFYN